jgi:hypothetical protein
VLFIGNNKITIHEIEIPEETLFSRLMDQYQFESTHEAEMNRKLFQAMQHGFKVAIVKAEPVNAALREDIHLGITVDTDFSYNIYENLASKYIEMVAAQHMLNSWITRPASGGMVTFVADIPYGGFIHDLSQSSSVFFRWDFTYSNDKYSADRFVQREISGQVIGREITPLQVMGINTPHMHKIRVFEELFSRSGNRNDNDLFSLEQTGGTILYTPQDTPRAK